MKKTKNLLLTFDYELSLGSRSGRIEKCMLEPTKHILRLLKKYKLKSIFFIDTTCIMAMQNKAEKYPELNQDILEIKKQVVEIAKAGHYIYHHIHPHWVDALYLPKERQWDLSNTKKYALNSFNENEIIDFFKKSKKILEAWILPEFPDYKAEGFRAGGLFVQPFSKLKKAFLENEIKYDFSVMFDASSNISVAQYNYLTHPEKPIYKFTDTVLSPLNDGFFTEYAVEMIENKGIYKILNGIWHRLFEKKPHIDNGKAMKNKINHSDKKNNFSSKESFSFELINPAKNLLYLSEIKKKDFIHFLSHPKSISIDNIKYTNNLFNKLSRKYQFESDFKKFKY